MSFFTKFLPSDKEYSLKLSVYLTVLSVLIIFDSIGIIDVNQYILMAISIIFFITLPYKECKYLLFFLLPLSCALQAFTIPLGIIILIIKAPQKVFSNSLGFIILLLAEVIHVIFSYNITIVEFLYYSTYLFTFFYLLSDGDNVSSPRFCTKMSILGFMIALFAVVYGMITTFGINGAFSGMFRDGTVIGSSAEEGAVGVSLNANSVAYYSLSLLSLLLWNPSRLRMYPLIWVIGVLLAVLSGIISFSRTWIILVSLFIFFYFIISSHKKAIFIILISVIITVPALSIFSDISLSYSNRFNSSDIRTAGNRKNIMEDLFEYMNENADTYIWGTGVLTYNNNTNTTISPHNAIQQIFVCTGLLGLFVFAGAIIKFCNKYYCKELGLISLLPFIICFLDIQTIQFLSPHFLMLPILITLYCIKLEPDEYEFE